MEAFVARFVGGALFVWATDTERRRRVVEHVGRRVVGSISDTSFPEVEDQSISQAELQQLLNVSVLSSELWQRPLKSTANSVVAHVIGFVHQGVVVNLDDGSKYIVHKFQDTGDQQAGAQPLKAKVVVAPFRNIGAKWTIRGSKRCRESSVGDFLRECGTVYDVYSGNCQHAAQRMMALM